MKGARHLSHRMKQVPGTEDGQAVFEYIILLSVIAMLFFAVAQGLDRMGVTKLITKPLTEDFARAYRYGHPKAKGFDDGGPEKHPMARNKGSFRIFLNSANQ